MHLQDEIRTLGDLCDDCLRGLHDTAQIVGFVEVNDGGPELTGIGKAMALLLGQLLVAELEVETA